jgi:hypothetical protein
MIAEIEEMVAKGKWASVIREVEVHRGLDPRSEKVKEYGREEEKEMKV